MKQLKRKGYILIIITVLIAVAGMMLFVLTGASKTLQHDSIITQLNSNAENMLTSGRLWIKQNHAKLSQAKPNTKFNLDVNLFDIPDPSCIVTVKSVKDDKAQIEISVSCSRKRITRNLTAEYTIELAPPPSPPDQPLPTKL